MAEIHLSTLKLICALNFEYPGVIVESKRAPRHPGAVRREWRLWRPALSNKHTVCRRGCWSFCQQEKKSSTPHWERRKASAGAGRRAGAGRETRRRERDPAPGKENPPNPAPGEEESFKRKNRHMLMARNKAFLSAPIERSNLKTFSGPHTRTTKWSMNIVYIYILLSLPRCLLCPLLSGTMPKTSWFIADSKTPADDDGLMTPKRCVHHHLPCTVRGLFSFYTFQKSWN